MSSTDSLERLGDRCLFSLFGVFYEGDHGTIVFLLPLPILVPPILQPKSAAIKNKILGHIAS